MLAHLRHTRISAKKLNIVADLVRGKQVNEALTLLKFIPKKGALILSKAITSAAANAEHNFKQNREDLFIETIDIGRGMFYKRYVPASRGRTWPLLCATANLTVRIGVKEEKTTQKSPKKTTVKKDS